MVYFMITNTETFLMCQSNNYQNEFKSLYAKLF